MELHCELVGSRREFYSLTSEFSISSRSTAFLPFLVIPRGYNFAKLYQAFLAKLYHEDAEGGSIQVW